MSKARLYAFTTPSFEAFQKPVSELQEQWKNSLDSYTTAKTDSALNKALHSFSTKQRAISDHFINRFTHTG